MDDTRFWDIIHLLDWDAEDDDAVIAPAVEELARRDLRDLLDFEEVLAQKLYALDGEVFALNSRLPEGYLSSDGFLYSRCAVVAGGKLDYENVLAHPETMPQDHWFENLLYIGPRAFEEKTGEEFQYVTKYSYESGSNRDGWPSLTN